MCGFPTGEVNAFQLTPWGFWELFHGYVGPIGFRPWLDRGDDQAWTGPETPLPLAFGSFDRERGGTREIIRGISSLPLPRGSSGDPVLIAQLYGRPCRCYHVGDGLTDDYIAERVNIGLSRSNRIMEIWFG